jgi:transcriptional regulator with XRE-family HTH domain
MEENVQVIIVNIGNRIKSYCRKNHITNKELAKRLGITNDAVYKLFLRRDIQVNALIKISQVLNHDFFRDYLMLLENNVYKAKAESIQENLRLTAENKALILENEVLKKVLKIVNPEG